MCGREDAGLLHEWRVGELGDSIMTKKGRRMHGEKNAKTGMS